MGIVGILAGVTAAGKTEAAIQMAHKKGWSIVSADSRQVYQGLPIGTAQPTLAEQMGVKHHLIDFLPLQERFSVGDFLRQVEGIVADSQEPLLIVGGTGFYIKGLIEGMPEIPEVSKECIHQTEVFLATQGLDALYESVRSVDPEFAEAWTPGDSYRLQRAWNVYQTTGRPYSSYKDQSRTSTYGDLPMIVLSPDREIIAKRMEQRIQKMISEGWVEEWRLAAQNFGEDAVALQTLGYPEIADYSRGTISYKELVERVSAATRRLGKRQRTFFRGSFSQAQWVEEKNGAIKIMDLW
jgi:tRNA dimethylallyltransferase